VKQDYLWNSLLVFVDCSAIGVHAHEKLFMPNREHLRDDTLKKRLVAELEDKLRHHKELEQIAVARRKTELSESPEVSETFIKFGMTLIALALLRQDLEAKKREDETPDSDDADQTAKRPDIHDTVAEVTSAIAPFLLPLVESLSQITGEMTEPLSAVAGEAA
jgi:hypothetical protein